MKKIGGIIVSEKMIALGTPFYKIKHDFKSNLQSISEINDDESEKKFYTEADWKTLQEWKLKRKAAETPKKPEEKVEIQPESKEQ